MPKISIIVPVYKVEQYIRRCLDSIVNQTFTDWECILVDDGSPDNSGNICDEYAEKDKRFKIIHKHNEGVAKARQTGLDNCVGEYVIHTDPDDWVEKNMLEYMIEGMIQSNCDLLIADFYYDKGDKVIISTQTPSKNEPLIVLHDILNGTLYGCCWNKMIKKSVIDKYKVKFICDLSYCEDVLFWVAILQNQVSVSYLNKAFYHYNVSISTSLTSLRTKERIEQRFKFIELLEKSVNCQEFQNEIIKRKLSAKLMAFQSNFFDDDFVYNLYKECNDMDCNLKNTFGLGYRMILKFLSKKYFFLAHLINKMIQIKHKII